MIYQYIRNKTLLSSRNKEEMKQLAYIKLMQAVNSFREDENH